MNLSIWEKQSFFAPADCLIIGSGFVGLWSAYWLKKKDPRLRITILERGLIPSGASTRNAGFACFGSLTELLADADIMGIDRTLELVEMRYKGIERIRKTFPGKQIDFEPSGGFDLLTDKDRQQYSDLDSRIEWLNRQLKTITGNKATFQVVSERISELGLTGFSTMIENRFEGGLHSGKLCQQLLALVQGMGVTILNGMDVTTLERSSDGFIAHLSQLPELMALQVLICTNAFATKLLPDIEVVPARGQVLLTSPIEDLPLKGTFHYDHGYYYFRNLGDRILLGGARNKDFLSEQTLEIETTGVIQTELERFLSEHILAGREYHITDRWSGIMAMGPEKLPVIRQVEDGLFCAVRMSGMGVALAPIAGQKIARMMLQ